MTVDASSQAGHRGAPLSRRAALVTGHPVAVFLSLAYLLSWASWLPLAVAGRSVRPGSADPTHFPGLLGPLLAAIAVAVLTDGRRSVRELLARIGRWRVDRCWWLAAFSPLAFFAVAAPVARVVDGAWPAWGGLGRVNGFGEETGWRGFAIPALQRTHGPLAASLILVLFWALWHTPLFWILDSFRGFGGGTLVGFFFGMASGAALLTWLVNRSGSVPVVAVWHGTHNLAATTTAARGTIAAVVSALVMVQAVVLVGLELRARRRGRPSVLGPIPAGVGWT